MCTKEREEEEEEMETDVEEKEAKPDSISVSLSTQLSLWNAVRGVVEGGVAGGGVWGLLSQHNAANNGTIDYLFKVHTCIWLCLQQLYSETWSW